MRIEILKKAMMKQNSTCSHCRIKFQKKKKSKKNQSRKKSKVNMRGGKKKVTI